jgi:1,4-alpha-glucan branching enzyme
MINREAKAGELHLTFVLPQEEPAGRVSVIGDFNSWTAGVRTLARRSNGTRRVKVKVASGAAYRFRYLGEGGHWFNDPHPREDDDAVVLT